MLRHGFMRRCNTVDRCTPVCMASLGLGHGTCRRMQDVVLLTQWPHSIFIDDVIFQNGDHILLNTQSNSVTYFFD